MKRLAHSLIIFAFLCVVFMPHAHAQNASSSAVTNNKVGIHILSTDEVAQAAQLVNSSGGDYGYVTIPIQVGDKDIEKWQKFMDDCRTYHLIPLIRLATQPDPIQTDVWQKPTNFDIVDFANFLDSLSWPTQERYVIMFNEVNRDNEWGGEVNAGEYAQLLQFAVTEFKSKSPDFFIISAGLDNAAADTAHSENEYQYLSEMNGAVPGIFNQVDGLGSHSYANPGFSSPPTANTRESIESFRYEKNLVESFSSKNLPIFITETGWTRDGVSDDLIGQYFQQAFNTVWNSPDVVAVTPFLLLSGDGPFVQFSFLRPDGSPTPLYGLYKSITKIAGHPVLAAPVLAAESKNVEHLPIMRFGPPPKPNLVASFLASLGEKFLNKK